MSSNTRAALGGTGPCLSWFGPRKSENHLGLENEGHRTKGGGTKGGDSEVQKSDLRARRSKEIKTSSRALGRRGKETPIDWSLEGLNTQNDSPPGEERRGKVDVGEGKKCLEKFSWRSFLFPGRVDGGRDILKDKKKTPKKLTEKMKKVNYGEAKGDDRIGKIQVSVRWNPAHETLGNANGRGCLLEKYGSP